MNSVQVAPSPWIPTQFFLSYRNPPLHWRSPVGGINKIETDHIIHWQDSRKCQVSKQKVENRKMCAPPLRVRPFLYIKICLWLVSPTFSIEKIPDAPGVNCRISFLEANLYGVTPLLSFARTSAPWAILKASLVL